MNSPALEHEHQIQAGLQGGVWKSLPEARRQLVPRDQIDTLSETEIVTAAEEAYRLNLEQKNAFWKENMLKSWEFTITFDDHDYLEQIIWEAFQNKLFTGLVRINTEYQPVSCTYMWDEKGLPLRENKECHTGSITETGVILKFSVPPSLRDDVFLFFNERIAQKWDTPFIKAREEYVNKKFYDYMLHNSQAKEKEPK